MVGASIPLAAVLAAAAVPGAAAFRGKLDLRAPVWEAVERTAEGTVPVATAAVVAVSPPATTTGPSMQEGLAQMELLKRDFTLGTDTCGYYYDDSIYKCDAGLSCAVSGSIFGCCRGVNCGATSTNFYTYCQDYSAPACVASTQGYYTLCCTSVNWPYCYTGLSTYSGLTVTHYGCGNNVFSGVQSIVGAPFYATASTSTSTLAPSSTTFSAPAATTTSASPDATTGGGSAPIGAIVGGVVGGIAVIGLIVFLLFWFVFRKKPEHQQPKPFVDPNAPPMMQHGGPTGYPPVDPNGGMMMHNNGGAPMPPVGPGSPSPPAYDPRFSQAYGGAYAPMQPGKDMYSPTSTVAPIMVQQTGSGPSSPGMGNSPSPAPSPNPEGGVLAHDMTGQSSVYGQQQQQPQPLPQQQTGMSGVSAVGTLSPQHQQQGMGGMHSAQQMPQQPGMGPSPMSLYGGPSPQVNYGMGAGQQGYQHVYDNRISEVPAMNPMGMGNNRAELG